MILCRLKGEGVGAYWLRTWWPYPPIHRLCDISTECTFIDERRAVGIRLEPAAAIVDAAAPGIALHNATPTFHTVCKISDGFSGASLINGLSVAEDMPETHAQNQSRGGGFGARRVCLRRDARRNCSPYCRTIAAAGSSRIPTPPRSSTYAHSAAMRHTKYRLVD